MRHFRSSRGIRRGGMKPVIQSYKKVINEVNANFAAGQRDSVAVVGVDSVAAGQTSNIDPNVPTGAMVKYIEFQMAMANNGANGVFVNTSIQYLESGQTAVDPIAVGGNAQRNQVLHQRQFMVGDSQNMNQVYKFKVPPRFQRVREGRRWVFTWRNSGTIQFASQIIYKFYR